MFLEINALTLCLSILMRSLIFYGFRDHTCYPSNDSIESKIKTHVKDFLYLR